MTEIEGWQTKDEMGVIMPWYTRPCLEWLQSLDLKGKRIFEYGVGYSTLWYESKGAITWGVDSSEYWAKLCRARHTNDKGIYIRTINDLYILQTKFDIICIDGLWRDECTEHALKKVGKGGYIIIDNWKQASADLADWPITEKLIEGMNTTVYKEPTHPDWKTLVISV